MLLINMHAIARATFSGHEQEAPMLSAAKQTE